MKPAGIIYIHTYIHAPTVKTVAAMKTTNFTWKSFKH